MLVAFATVLVAILSPIARLPWVPEVSHSRRAGAENTSGGRLGAGLGPSSLRARNLWNPRIDSLVSESN